MTRIAMPDGQSVPIGSFQFVTGGLYVGPDSVLFQNGSRVAALLPGTPEHDCIAVTESGELFAVNGNARNPIKDLQSVREFVAKMEAHQAMEAHLGGLIASVKACYNL